MIHSITILTHFISVYHLYRIEVLSGNIIHFSFSVVQELLKLKSFILKIDVRTLDKLIFRKKIEKMYTNIVLANKKNRSSVY